jgi:hypothetical protein
MGQDGANHVVKTSVSTMTAMVAPPAYVPSPPGNACNGMADVGTAQVTGLRQLRRGHYTGIPLGQGVRRGRRGSVRSGRINWIPVSSWGPECAARADPQPTGIPAGDACASTGDGAHVDRRAFPLTSQTGDVCRYERGVGTPSSCTRHGNRSPWTRCVSLLGCGCTQRPSPVLGRAS